MTDDPDFMALDDPFPGVKKPKKEKPKGARKKLARAVYRPRQAMHAASLANLKPPFEKGKVANPVGRPKGSRPKLSESFITALFADWEIHGAGVIEQVRVEKPVEYLKITASLLPKQVTIENKSDMTDDELNSRIHELVNSFDLGFGRETGAARAAPGAQAPVRTH